jgi:hypothetical protein
MFGGTSVLDSMENPGALSLVQELGFLRERRHDEKGDYAHNYGK